MKLKKSQTLNLAHKGPNFFLRKKKLKSLETLLKTFIYPLKHCGIWAHSFLSSPLFWPCWHLFVFIILFYMCRCFACVYDCAWPTCLVPSKARRVHWIPWNWRYRQFQLPCGCWDWKLGPLEEHPSLQSLVDILVFQISKGLLTFRALAHDALSAWNTVHSIQHLFSSSGFRVNHSARLQDCSASV